MRREVVIAAVLMACATLLTSSFERHDAVAAPRQKLVKPGKLRVAGRAMQCGRTPTLMDHAFWDYGGASDGLIILNPNKLETLPNTVRLYVYAHECGHQIYGRNEPRADCYAVKRGRKAGWLDGVGLSQICEFLVDHPGDYVHPPGPKRCQKMTECFNQAQPPRAEVDASR